MSSLDDVAFRQEEDRNTDGNRFQNRAMPDGDARLQSRRRGAESANRLVPCKAGPGFGRTSH